MFIYVNSIYKLHKKTFNSELSENKIIQSILSDTMTSDIIELDNEKNLSNKEKAIMRRKKYEKYLDQNQKN